LGPRRQAKPGSSARPQRHLRVAFLPWASICLKGPKYPPPATRPRTLGEHLKRRRTGLGLLQREAAARVGVDEDTFRLWEIDRTKPRSKAWAGIIQFLTYDPHPEPDTLGERLKAKRRALGWSQARLAAHLGWDEATVYRFERGDRQPKGKWLAQLAAFLGQASAVATGTRYSD
jgi:transcriptional regulator with XRE-family HTH domain